MMKSFATIKKNILIHVLALGTVCTYGMLPLYNHNQTECGKSNKKNKPALIFVPEGSYVVNKDQLQQDTIKDSSPVPIKGKEKTGKVIFISQKTIVYNLQNIFIGKKKKSNHQTVKIIAQKSYREPGKVNKKIPAKPININFLWNNNQNHFLLASDGKSCFCSTHNDHHKQLINANRFSINSFLFSKDELSEYNTHRVSYDHTIIFSIRPPPLKNMFHNAG